MIDQKPLSESPSFPSTHTMDEFWKRSLANGNGNGNEVETSGNELSNWETNWKRSRNFVEATMLFSREHFSLRFPSRKMSHS